MKNDEGLTYILQGEESGNIKIGWTTGPPTERLRAIQTGSWESLRLIGTLDGNVEAELHRKFYGERTAGGTEWFRPDAVIKQWWEKDHRIRHLLPLADYSELASLRAHGLDVLDEQIVTLKDACTYLPRRNGRKMHVATVYRWSVAGVRGVVLETIQVGGARCTSLEAIRRFSEELTRKTGVRRNRVRRSPGALTRLRQAERELAKAGIG
jgi:hypothetical protein